MTVLLPLLLGVPLGAAGLCLAVPSSLVRRAVLWLTTVAVLGFAVWALTQTADGSVLAHQVSGWPEGIAIPYVIDAFSALLLSAAAFLVLICCVYAAASGEDRDTFFPPLVLVLSGGVYGAFVTGDLFHLFVMVEVALVPSYVLLTRSGSARSVRAGRVYVTVNLFISTTLLLGIGLVYGVTGTVNLAELAGVAAESPAAGIAMGVVLIALAGKAAMVPVHWWLPRTYPFASPSISALFSGLLTKIGVYGLFRVYAVAFEVDERLQAIILTVCVVGMVVGVLGALGSSGMRAILSFHMSSQVGYVLIGLGLFTLAGLGASVFYLVQYMIAKTALFLAVGAVERVTGSGDLRRLGGIARRSPLLAAAFLVPALSLAGIPPLSGFVAKFALVVAAADAAAWVAAGAAVAVSLLTLLSMLKIWNGAFWGDEPAPAPAPPPPVPVRLILPVLALSVLSVVFGVGAEPMLALSETAATNLLDLSPYIEAVTGR